MAQYLTGACLCKKIVYRIDTASKNPEIILCHCNSCKRYTGSSFSANIVVPHSAFEYTRGSPKLYLDRSDKGGEVRREFCPDCGTPFTSLSSDYPVDIAVKSGTLDDEDRERCSKLALEIYVHRKDKWVDQIGAANVSKLNGSMES
ncbi:hypothetical protein N7495_009644 [Penicillium taxi]|uniref:uncharacterized protein n=1 Tax=Penicillium taxi TaxID=168475 RepID=UPI002545B64C|nr:uncharacterized protein N7495_009644 [Penicillium taxi]KAJ5885134.1 hypothetical protein N7495_009644 [Penicillium taxi]